MKSICVFTLFILIAGPMVPGAFAQDGRLDASFGVGGKVFNLLNGMANAVAVQSDGNIVVAGSAFAPDGFDENFMLARFNPDGTLDTSFGTDGFTQTNIDRGDAANHLAVLPDGRILVVGLTNGSGIPDTEGRSLIGLAQYHPDGTLDESFGTDGRLIADFAARIGGGAGHRVTDLKVDPSGAIYVAGSVRGNPNLGNDHPEAFLLARFMPDGLLDTSFGDEGAVVMDVGAETDVALLLAFQPNGIIAVGGFQKDGKKRLVLLGYGLDGSLDPTFGTDGIATVPLDTSFSPNGITILPDRKVVVAGDAETATDEGVAIARFNADGSLDGSFASGGIAFAALSGRMLASGSITDVFVADAVFEQDGSIFIGGSVDAADRDYFLTRFAPNGSLDMSFGTEGIVTTDFDDSFDHLFGLALQPDGKIVAAGYQFKLARYLTDTSTATEKPFAAPAFLLEPPYPNPFHREATISFTLAQSAHVRLVAYDVLGREVAVLADTQLPAGAHMKKLDAGSLSEGLYLLRLEADGAMHTQSILLMR